MSEDPLGWAITLERNDSQVVIHLTVPNDELEYGVDDALASAREAERTLDP